MLCLAVQDKCASFPRAKISRLAPAVFALVGRSGLRTANSGDSLRSLPRALKQRELEREGSRSRKNGVARTGRRTCVVERAAQFPSGRSNRHEPRARNSDSHRGASSRGQTGLSGTAREPARRPRPQNCLHYTKPYERSRVFRCPIPLAETLSWHRPFEYKRAVLILRRQFRRYGAEELRGAWRNAVASSSLR